MPGIARIIDAEIGGDAVEPGAEAGLGAVGFTRPIDPEKNLLRKLFGDRLVVDHAVHEVDDRLAVLLDQEIEAGHVAGAQLQHDGGIVHLAEVAGSMMGLRLPGDSPGVSGLIASVAISSITPSSLVRLRFFVDFRRESRR